MNKFAIGLLVVGAVAATGYVVSKIIKSKDNSIDRDLFDDDYDFDCDSCDSDEELDVVIPAEDIDDCEESPEAAGVCDDSFENLDEKKDSEISAKDAE